VNIAKHLHPYPIWELFEASIPLKFCIYHYLADILETIYPPNIVGVFISGLKTRGEKGENYAL